MVETGFLKGLPIRLGPINRNRDELGIAGLGNNLSPRGSLVSRAGLFFCPGRSFWAPSRAQALHQAVERLANLNASAPWVGSVGDKKSGLLKGGE